MPFHLVVVHIDEGAVARGEATQDQDKQGMDVFSAALGAGAGEAVEFHSVPLEDVFDGEPGEAALDAAVKQGKLQSLLKASAYSGCRNYNLATPM